MKINLSKPNITEKEIATVTEVLQSGNLAQGKIVDKFESEFAKFIGTKYAIATSNGTTALHLALLSLGIGPGDEVITTPFSFIASTNAILYTGAKAVLVDIDPDTFNINENLIEKSITKKTRAILPVHLYGLPSNMVKIKQLASKYNLFIIEDACQAHGATINSQKVGSIGNLGCFSFYPTKNMTTGEGGIVTTNDKRLAEKIKLLRNHGMKKRYHHEILGYNFRMTNMGAAIGIEQLKKLGKFNFTRQKNAGILTKGLKGIKGIQTPQIPTDSTHVFHQYTIKITSEFGISRDKLSEYLLEKGISTGIYYPIPIHKQKFFVNKYGNTLIPVSDKLSKQVLSLPVHPELSIEELQYIVNTIKEINPKDKP